MRRLVVGNWKMHGSLPENQSLLEKVLEAAARLRFVSCAVCVPFPYLHQARSALADSCVAWGAQNVSQYATGAYTGEVSAAMLQEFDCAYVIVGHSERRTLYGEDDHAVAAKAKAVLGFGMKPVICVGETLADRQAGSTEDVVAQQVDIVLDHLGVAAMRSSVVAYEPVWAIGTGHTATPDQAQAVHEFIRREISARNPEVGRGISILYGGSVKAANAAELFSRPDIDGALVGGASLLAAEFIAICQAADRETLERV